MCDTGHIVWLVLLIDPWLVLVCAGSRFGVGWGPRIVTGTTYGYEPCWSGMGWSVLDRWGEVDHKLTFRKSIA